MKVVVSPRPVKLAVTVRPKVTPMAVTVKPRITPLTVKVSGAYVPVYHDLEDDLSPALGGDLELNNHTILGLLDCGLMD